LWMKGITLRYLLLNFLSVTPDLIRGPDREEDVDLKSVTPANAGAQCLCRYLFLSLFISNPGYPTPVPSLAIPLSHKGNHREGLMYGGVLSWVL